MIPLGTSDPNRLDQSAPMALTTQAMPSLDGSTQALDHRRESSHLERWRRASDPIFLWPVLAAIAQFIL